MWNVPFNIGDFPKVLFIAANLLSNENRRDAWRGIYFRWLDKTIRRNKVWLRKIRHVRCRKLFPNF